jgi:hypothetical protein
MLASWNSWKVNEGIQTPLYGMECLQKLSKPNECQATNYQKPPRAYMVNIYGINLFYFFNSYTKDVIIYVLKVFWSRYQCGYRPKDYQKTSTHTRFIKRRCLVSFSIKRLYTHLRWLRSKFIIRPIHELMGHSHMVNMTHNFLYVSLCSTHVTSIERPHMGLTKLKLHNQTNI